MNNNFQNRKNLKRKLTQREKLFAGWISYSHPSITETFARAGFDFMFIDMEHSTISLEQGQRIIAASQSEGVPCIPRPVSHSNDYFKPLLDSGADGILMQMVEEVSQVKAFIGDMKFPPIGNRTYGGTSLATAAKSKEIVTDPVKQKALADALNKPKAFNK